MFSKFIPLNPLQEDKRITENIQKFFETPEGKATKIAAMYMPQIVEFGLKIKDIKDSGKQVIVADFDPLFVIVKGMASSARAEGLIKTSQEGNVHNILDALNNIIHNIDAEGAGFKPANIDTIIALVTECWYCYNNKRC